jgi:molybdate transport system regulatory protein
VTQYTNYRIRGRFWIESADGTILGGGRVRLLEAIAAHGSISAAARALHMSYRRAWELVEAINRCAPAPLVEKRPGGRGGGGAVLTATGSRAIRDYRALERRHVAFLEAETGRFAHSAAPSTPPDKAS